MNRKQTFMASSILLFSISFLFPALSRCAEAQAEKATMAEDPLVEAIVSRWQGDLDGMLENRLIRALVVQSNTMYFVDKAKKHGIAYELLIAFEEMINKSFPHQRKHFKTHVVFVPVARDQLIPALLDGRGDLAVSDITITPERQKLIDFSEPFFQGINEIVVTGPSSPALVSLHDLSGQVVFVRPSSSYWEHLQRLNRQFVDEGKPPVRLEPAPEQLEDEDLMEMVNAGLIDIIIVDDYKAELMADILPDIVLHPEMQINTDGQFAWMLRKNSPRLMAAVNAFAKTHKQGTLFGNIMIRRYIDSAKIIKRANAPQELEKFKRVVELFRHYGDDYDINYLLMMAKGYQESRLNHDTRSPVGAIGIMQIMPKTGKELGVGDIRKLEPNIHGGIKYHRALIDQYFKDAPMDDVDKTLFAFAAYNAGPGRIRGLRRAAEKRGLNPNVWFDNVELLAAESIGAETVTYVANIYKYYVAYKLLQEESKRKLEAKDVLR